MQSLDNNELWVSSFENLNDARDFLFSLDKKAFEMERWKFRETNRAIKSKICCLALSTAFYVKRLWNYYTNGMTGIVLGYDQDSIEKSIKKKFRFIHDIEQTFIENYSTLSSTPNFDPRFQCSKGHVKYTSYIKDAPNMSKLFLGEAEFMATDMYFYKDKSWRDENEFRYVFQLPDETPGFILKDIKPVEILVGFRMDQANYGLIYDYCKKNSIRLYVCTPDYTKTKFMIRECVYDPKNKEQGKKISLEYL